MDITKRIENNFPEFVLFNDGLDNIKFIDLENLAAILNDLIYKAQLGIIPESQQRYFTDKVINEYFKNYENYIKNIFQFINEFFLEEKDTVHVVFLEVLCLNKFGYDYSKEYLNKDIYQYFIENFPYEQYKDAWNTSNYYTEEEYQKIIGLSDVEDDEEI